jgi:hypothetical protein
MSFPVYQCQEWQCRYVFPDGRCCVLPKEHTDHRPASHSTARCRDCGATSGSTDCDVTGFACVMEPATPQNAEAGAVDEASSVGAQNRDLRRALTVAEQSLETVKGERDGAREAALIAERDSERTHRLHLQATLDIWQKQIRGYQEDLRRRDETITLLMGKVEDLESALLRERPQDGVLGFVDRAVVADFQRRVEQTAAREGHRCSGCGHRWEDDPNLRGVELCGECWRKGQSAIFSRESAMSQNAGATKPEGSQAVGAQSLSSSLLTLVEQWRRDAANLERICSADRACDYTGWEGEVDKIRACARELESALLRERPQEP